MRRDAGPELNAPPAGGCELFWLLSPAKTFAVAMDNDWYCCCPPPGRKAWPGEGKVWPFMAFFEVAPIE